MKYFVIKQVRLLALSTLALGCGHLQKHSDVDPPALNLLLSQYPRPISFSPNNEKLLLRSSTDNELLIYDKKRNAFISRFRSPHGSFGHAWHPDSSRLVVAAQNYTERGEICMDLFSWDIEADQSKKFVSCHGERSKSLDWSPDGSRLAYSYFSSTQPRRLVLSVYDVSNPHRLPRLEFEWPASIKNVQWLNHGRRIAYTEPETESKITFRDFPDGKKSRMALDLSHWGYLKSYLFAPKGDSLLASVLNKKMEVELYKVDAKSLRRIRLPCNTDHPGTILWFSDGLRLISGSIANPNSLIICTDSDEQRLVIEKDVVWVHRFGIANKTDELTAITESFSSGKYVAYTASPPHFDFRPVALPNFSGQEDGPWIDPEWISITSFDGAANRALIWRPRQEKEATQKRALIIAHGGNGFTDLKKEYRPHAEFMARNGITVIMPQLRKMNPQLQKSIDELFEARANDIIGAHDYLSSTLQVPARNIVVMGESSGNQSVASAIYHAKDRFASGGVIFHQAVPTRGDRCPPFIPRKGLLVFQGGADGMSDADLKSMNTCLQPLIREDSTKVKWRVFDHEPHGIESIEPNAEIITSTYRMLVGQ